MKPNTASGFILAGLALMLTAFPFSPSASRASRLFALLFGLIGLLTLAEYLLSWNPGFDQWLFPEAAGTVGTSSPGRMAPDTALCFLLLAASLILSWSQKKTLLITAVTLSLLVAIIVLVDLFCHLTNPFDIVGLWGLTVMAVHTAILFTMLGLTLAWGTWPRQISVWSLTGRIVRSFAIWTLILASSLAWNLRREGVETLNSAIDIARASIQKDLCFRKWATSHGGVYVIASKKTPPNPYLKVPDRDVLTTTGLALTLMNPAYMLREMQNNFSDNYGTRSRIVSLKPLNPDNDPDAWEARALTSFEREGGKEFIQIHQLDGDSHLRMMVPFIVETGCLKCHADQGYAVGDIRGGIDSSVPLAPLLRKQQEDSARISLAYCLIWAFGMTGIALFYRREHRLEIANLQEKAFSASVINSLPGTFYAYEDGLRLIRWNKNLEAMSGYSADELLGRHPLSWFSNKDKARAQAVFDTVAETGEIKFEAEIVFKEKSAPFLLTGSWLILGDNKYLIGVGIDLSEQKRLEEGLRQAQKMEAMGTLSGGIAHDFNNILSALVGYTELALIQTQNNKPCHKELAEIIKATDRATKLIHQILIFSRKQDPEKHPLQASLIVKEALELLRASIPATIEIRQDIQSQSTILADSTQIHQVIMNLCTNASHAMLEGGGVLSVTLKDIVVEQKIMDGGTEIDPGHYVLLTVSDTGCGMDQKTLTKIFNPYFTTKAVGKGTGLGLAVAHCIIKGHHGLITVCSDPGHGATFKVYLPVSTEKAAPALETADAAPPVTDAQERLMFVDDESAVCEAMKTILTQAGYQVSTFANGLEAWQALSQSPADWDALITDVTMPEMTGDQLTAKALKLRPELPIILCSGYSEILDVTTRKDGVFALLQKPVSKNILLATIAKALGKSA